MQQLLLTDLSDLLYTVLHIQTGCIQTQSAPFIPAEGYNGTWTSLALFVSYHSIIEPVSDGVSSRLFPAPAVPPGRREPCSSLTL